MQAFQLWQAILGELEIQLPRPTFETWVRGTRLQQRDNQLYVIGVPSSSARQWLEQNLHDPVVHAVMRVTGEPARLRFVVDKTPRPPVPPAGLRPEYTFSRFVVGKSNRLAHTAATTAAAASETSYNPLFVHGGVGLGKTHLLQAIGNAAGAAGRTVLYTTSERFTNDLIQSIRRRTMERFRAAYRTVDVLLLDDVQFVAGRESTQEELFHTFNELHRHRRQVVVASDRPPQAIAALGERLRSRFEWGLMADIAPPSLETRVAILQARARENGVTLPDAVVTFIAAHVNHNVRELEGALNRVLACAAIGHAPIDLDLTRNALADLLPQRRAPTVGDVITAVAHYYGLSVAALCGSGRARTISLPRQVCMYLARTETSASLPEIGAQLGDRDHTTVLYGYEKIAGAIGNNDELRQITVTIRNSLQEPV